MKSKKIYISAEETKRVRKANLLRISIVKKFGSVAAFANHSENPLQPWTVIRTLSGSKKKNVDTLLKKIDYFSKKLKADERKLSEKQIKKIRRVLLMKVGSAAEFNRRFPEYSRPYISTILNGKKKFFDEKTQEFYELICKLDANQNVKR